MINFKNFLYLTVISIALSSFSAQAMVESENDRLQVPVIQLRIAHDTNQLITDQKSGKRFKVTSFRDSSNGNLDEKTAEVVNYGNGSWRAFATGNIVPGYQDPEDPTNDIPGDSEDIYADLVEVN